MQHSSLVLFCDECGLANDPAASHCAGCQHTLTRTRSGLSMPPVAPITPAPPTVLEVIPGPLFFPEKQRMRPSEACDFRPGSVLAGRYQIQEEIGRGGFSIVYRAVDQSDAQSLFKKRYHLPRRPPPGFWRFSWLGVLVGAAPFLLWHLFFG